MFEVLFESNMGESFIERFDTEQDAEDFIEEQLWLEKRNYLDLCVEYDYGDFYNCNGNSTTEIWEVGGGGYTCWTRLWT